MSTENRNQTFTPVAQSFVARGASGSSVLSKLSSESHVIATDSGGGGGDFTNATTTMTVEVNLVDETIDWSFSINAVDCTASITDNAVSVTAMSEDDAYVDITAIRTGFESQIKRFDLSVAKAGVDGAGSNAKVVTLTADRSTFYYPKAGGVDPATITFTAVGQNLTGSPVFTVESGTAVLLGSGTTRTLNSDDLTSDGATIRATWDGQYDDVSITKVVDGVDGTNGSDGTGAAGDDGLSVAELTVYKRASSTPTTPTGGSYTFDTATLAPPSGWTQNIPTGAGFVYASITSAAIVGNTGTDSSLVWTTPVKTYADGSGVDMVFVRSATQPTTPSDSVGTPAGWYTDVDSVPAGSNILWSSVGTRVDTASNWVWQLPIQVEGDSGDNGLSIATVYAYQRSASLPTGPSANTTYTFATKTLTGLNNGWTQTIPANDGNPLYVTVATASSAGATDTIASGEWSGIEILVEDGSNGLNVASVFLYKRAASTPSVPSTTSTFTFSTGVLTGHNNGWTQTIPAADGNPVYVTTATAVSVNSTDTITTGEWATPNILAQDGSDGTSPEIIFASGAGPSLTATYNTMISANIPARGGTWIIESDASASGSSGGSVTLDLRIVSGVTELDIATDTGTTVDVALTYNSSITVGGATTIAFEARISGGGGGGGGTIKLTEQL